MPDTIHEAIVGCVQDWSPPTHFISLTMYQQPPLPCKYGILHRSNCTKLLYFSLAFLTFRGLSTYIPKVFIQTVRRRRRSPDHYSLSSGSGSVGSREAVLKRRIDKAAAVFWSRVLRERALRGAWHSCPARGGAKYRTGHGTRNLLFLRQEAPLVRFAAVCRLTQLYYRGISPTSVTSSKGPCKSTRVEPWLPAT